MVMRWGVTSMCCYKRLCVAEVQAATPQAVDREASVRLRNQTAFVGEGNKTISLGWGEELLFTRAEAAYEGLSLL